MIERTSTLRSYTAMLLVALWALQPLVAVIHSLEHTHRFCPEHQAFEETARGSGQGPARRSSGLPVLAAFRMDGDVDAVLSAHEACPLQTASSRGDAHVSETSGGVSGRLDTSVQATAPPVCLCSVPILAIAPKSSPPARTWHPEATAVG